MFQLFRTLAIGCASMALFLGGCSLLDQKKIGISLSDVSSSNSKILTYHQFERGQNNWHSYDYTGYVAQPGYKGYNHFLQTMWMPKGSGGVNNSGYTYTDDEYWRVDTPENPDSILAFINYHYWNDQSLQEPLSRVSTQDWRNARVSVYTRGHKLDLKGSKLYFWIMGGGKCGATRYHLITHPLKVENDHWGTQQSFLLSTSEKDWHRSYPPNSAEFEPNCQRSVADSLRYSTSYGFSFLGFSDEVTGELAIDEFKVEKVN